MNLFPSIKEMAVKGHDGTEYFLSMNNAQPVDFDTIRNAYEQIDNSLHDKFERMVLSGTPTEAEAGKQHSHETVEAVANKFGWTYERRP